jgi:hypothetical protein
MRIIMVAYRGHSARKFFVEWNKRTYACLTKTEMEAFAAWMDETVSNRKTIVKL